MARHRRDPGLSEHAAAPPPRPLRRRGGPSPRRLDALALAAILVAALALLVAPRAARAAAPVITTVTAQTGGTTVLVTFDQGVFANNDGTGDLTAANFTFDDASNGGVDIQSVGHLAGSPIVTLLLTEAAAAPATDTVDIDASVFNAGGEALASGTPVTVTADDTPPSLTGATVENASPGSVLATFTEMLFAMDATGFTVEVNAVANAITGVTSVGLNVLSFALTTPVAAGDTVTLAYAGGGTAADIVGNAVAAFAAEPVTNNVAVDATPPALLGAGVNGATLTLVYDETLDGGSVPENGDFAPFVDGNPDAVTNVAIVGNAVILTLTTAADADDVVTISYTAGASPIQDSAGNDATALTNEAVSNSTGIGPDFPLCSADNTVSCVLPPAVSDASTLPTPKVFLAAGLVQVQLMNASSTSELATLGADGSTVYTIGLRLRDYTPRMLIGGGRDVGFTIDTTPQPDHTLVTIVTKPVTADQIQLPAPSMDAWPTGAADKANLHVERMVSLAISDLSIFPAGDQVLLTGAALVTDAQAFTQPVYDAGTQVLSLDIAGPHFLSDGVTAHFGFFEAHLPQALLTNWGVTQPSDITAVYTEGSSGLTVTSEAGGMRVDIDVSYSSGTVSLQQALSTNANLAALALSAGTLSPAFAAGTTAYAASVGNDTTSVNVTPTLADSTATFTVAGIAGTSGAPSAVALNVGANAIAVAVTAENGTTRTYTVTVTRAAPADNGSGGDDIATPSPAPTPTPTPAPAATPAPPSAGGVVRPAVTVVNKITTPVSSTEATKAETAGALGRAAVTVPPAALPANTDVSVGVIDDLASLVAQVPPPAGVQLALGFEVTATTADGDEILAPFAEAVALEFTVSADAIPSGGTADELVVAFWNGRSWVEVNTTVTVNADGTFTLAALTDHFTVFAVLRTPFRGTFDRPVTEPGVTAALWRGGTTARLLERVPTARSIWVFDGGRRYGYIAGAPEFANAAFARLFATGIVPAGTITFVVLPE